MIGVKIAVNWLVLILIAVAVYWFFFRRKSA